VASLVGKSKFSGVYVNGSKYCSPSRKHYRPYHRCINKKESLFDNDIIWIDGGVKQKEIGINKERWNNSKPYYYNDFKDGEYPW